MKTLPRFESLQANNRPCGRLFWRAWREDRPRRRFAPCVLRPRGKAPQTLCLKTRPRRLFFTAQTLPGFESLQANNRPCGRLFWRAWREDRPRRRFAPCVLRPRGKAPQTLCLKTRPRRLFFTAQTLPGFESLQANNHPYGWLFWRAWRDSNPRPTGS